MSQRLTVIWYFDNIALLAIPIKYTRNINCIVSINSEVYNQAFRSVR